MRVSNDQKYVCGRRLYVCIIHNIQRPRFERNYIFARDQRKKHDVSIIAKNKPHAHHKTDLHTVKVYNARPVSLIIEVLLIKILLFLTTEMFTFSKVINAFKR